MKSIRLVFLPIILAAALPAVYSQQPAVTATPTPEASVPRERREQALAKILEGQRLLWRGSPARAGTNGAVYMRQAKAAFQRAIELDPTLAEAYTALAEIAITAPPNDIDEAVRLATIAVKLQPDNFGGHRILARLYTFKSRLNNGTMDPVFTQKAIDEWKEVTRLDPRNAEGWAFLAEFYGRAGKTNEQIDALRKWTGAATPLESQFYRRVMGGRETLSPEAASMKLGSALVETGKVREAVEVLSLVIADDPSNGEAADLLREALQAADARSAGVAIEALQQAVYANPENSALVTLLAQVHARSGNLAAAAKVIGETTERLRASDNVSAAMLQISMGDIYFQAEKYDEAIAAYEKALDIRSLTPATMGPAEQEFAMLAFERMIRTYKAANRPNDARAVIERARKLLGKDDLFADRELISFLRESGNAAEALEAIRSVRAKMPDDYGYMRLEASVLTDLGRVDEAAALIKKLIGGKPEARPITKDSEAPGGPTRTFTALLAMYDDFANYLFISQLYNQAGRGKEAVEAANQAFAAANGPERKQIAKLTLATAQQMSGDHAAAEATLREILKQSPGNPIALNNLGYFMLERDLKIEEAFNMIQEAVKIDPTNPSYLDSLGWAYYKLGKLDEAEKHLKDAARLDTASSTIREHLGDVYLKQGKKEEAAGMWQKALTLATDAADIKRLKDKLK